MKQKLQKFDLTKIKEGTNISVTDGVNWNCYYIVKIVDDKTIVVHPYSICGDQEKALGMGHQNWKYFKTVKEEHEYLSKYVKDQPEYDGYENKDQTWVIRYGDVWMKREDGEYVKVVRTSCGYIYMDTLNYYWDWEF